MLGDWIKQPDIEGSSPGNGTYCEEVSVSGAIVHTSSAFSALSSIATAVRERCAARVSIVGKPSIEHIHSMHLSI